MNQPNILLLLTDQHRLSAVGAYGPTPCRTPHLDRLAREGVLFRHAYTSSPVCSPARAGIITGLHPHRHGLSSNIHQMGCAVQELQDRPFLLPRRLERAGYGCGYTGKWHLGTDGWATAFCGWENRSCLPRDVGFIGDQLGGHGDGGHDYPEYQAWLAARGASHRVAPWNERTRQFDRFAQLETATKDTIEAWIAERTLDVFDQLRSGGKPAFVWANWWGPHLPYYPTAEFLDLYRHVEIPPWPNWHWPAAATPGFHRMKIHRLARELGWDDWATAVRYYYAFTSLIDHQIGRVVDGLRARGELERTVIVMSADHGETNGSHGGLTDKGWHHFEETHRIPLIVRLPGAAHAGRSVDTLVSSLDLLPTFCDYAGADGSGTHGHSLRPLIEGKPQPERPDEIVVEFHGVNGVGACQRTLRYASLKYGWNAGGDEELYDLAIDPHELVNLAADPRRRGDLLASRERLAAWMQRTGDFARGMYLASTP